MTIRNLEFAVRPRSLAVFGASARKGSVGRIVMENIVAGGFEGAHDGAQHRGTAQGWKADGLPWVQE